MKNPPAPKPAGRLAVRGGCPVEGQSAGFGVGGVVVW